MTGFKRAQRTAVKLKALVIGPSGGGKTLGALTMATGMAPGKVAVIDSENERASYYADAVTFDAMSLERHRPADYEKAIDAAVEAGYEVVVIDSLSHAWLDLLGRKEQYDKDNPRSNQWTNWRTFGGEWDALIRHILEAPIHVIATARSKQAYEQTESNGRKSITKMGLQPILRENTEYEFALVFDLLPSHKARATKDNTRRFDQDDMALWNLCDGTVVRELNAWMSGAAPAVEKPKPEARGGLVEFEPITKEQRELLDRVLSSHVFSDDERKRAAQVSTKKAAMKAIDYATEQVRERKAKEKAEADAKAAEASTDTPEPVAA